MCWEINLLDGKLHYGLVKNTWPVPQIASSYIKENHGARVFSFTESGPTTQNFINHFDCIQES